MTNIKKNTDYVIISTIFSSENFNAKIAYKGKKTTDNFYIINEFNFEKEFLDTFTNLFNIFKSDDKPSMFVDFFVENDKFYSIFKYTESENIIKKYKKNFNTTTFDNRCIVLEKILMYIDKIYKFPHTILGCVTEPENIKIDSDTNIKFIYNFKNMNKYSDSLTSKNLILKNITDIICIILEAEVEAKFNKELHIVIDKCKRDVYNSLPELIIDLKRAEKICKTSSWISYIKLQLSLRKHILNKISKISLNLIIIAGLWYFIYSQMTSGQVSGSSTILVSIGGINYNANEDDDSDKIISSENIDNQIGTTEISDIILSEGLDMEYEDYIVQYGDTVTSISENYYNDNAFATAISTFNGIDINDTLDAGSILKLPNRTAISLYISS